MIPKMMQRNTTWVRNRFVPWSTILGMARKSKMAGAMPKRKVGPGRALQQDGRSHHTNTHRKSAVADRSPSSMVSERFSTGVKK